MPTITQQELRLLNTFNYFNDNVTGAPVVKSKQPIRFLVRNIATAIDTAKIQVEKHPDEVWFGNRDAVGDAADSFETIMAQYQAMEKELVNLRYFKRQVEAASAQLSRAINELSG